MTRKFSILTMLLCLAIISVSCGGGKSNTVKDVPEAEVVTATAEISIEGMTCTGCENTICTSIEKIPGVKAVTASHTDGKATVEFDAGKVDTAAIKAAIDAAGYKALKVTTAVPEAN
ncbi:MAG: cation transporter [Bacteroidales bacterium]|nr:cation transporter [Bacteroidales bacterium]